MSFHLRDAEPGAEVLVEFNPDQRTRVVKLAELRKSVVLEETPLEYGRACFHIRKTSHL